MAASAVTTADPVSSSPGDAEIVRRIRGGDRALFEVLMRRHNQRAYRTARAVIKNEAEVEDVMQQAYINAFTHLHQFEERAQFSTWLTRIVLNEAFARRDRLRATEAAADSEGGSRMEMITTPGPDPERQAYAGELRRVLEDAIDALPDGYRAVFVLREVEGLSTTETGAGLGLGDEAVKTRLHRARAMLRRALSARVGAAVSATFQFPAVRCDRVVAAVLQKIEL
jgi:RNA polymerase sigma-70 factor (ECF subfamily)